MVLGKLQIILLAILGAAQCTYFERIASSLPKWMVKRAGDDARFSYTDLVRDNDAEVVQGFLGIGGHRMLNVNFKVDVTVRDVFMKLPKDIFEQLFLRLSSISENLPFDERSKFWTVPRNIPIASLPEIRVEIGGAASVLQPAGYVEAATGKILIKALADNSGRVVLGERFVASAGPVEAKKDLTGKRMGFRGNRANLNLGVAPIAPPRTWTQALWNVPGTLIGSAAGRVWQNLVGKKSVVTKPTVFLSLEGVRAGSARMVVSSVPESVMQFGAAMKPAEAFDYYGFTQRGLTRKTRGRVSFVNEPSLEWDDTLVYGNPLAAEAGVFSISPESEFSKQVGRFIVSVGEGDGTIAIKHASGSRSGFRSARITQGGVSTKQWRVAASVLMNSQSSEEIQTELLIDFSCNDLLALPENIYSKFSEWFKVRGIPDLEKISFHTPYLHRLPALTIKVEGHAISIPPSMYLEKFGWGYRVKVARSSSPFVRISYSALKNHTLLFDAKSKTIGFKKQTSIIKRITG